MRPDYAEQTLEGTIANEYEAGLFQIPSGSMMILLEGVTYLENDQPLEYFKSVYRGDRFRFKLMSQRNSEQGNAFGPRIFVSGVDVVQE